MRDIVAFLGWALEFAGYEGEQESEKRYCALLRFRTVDGKMIERREPIVAYSASYVMTKEAVLKRDETLLATCPEQCYLSYQEFLESLELGEGK